MLPYLGEGVPLTRAARGRGREESEGEGGEREGGGRVGKNIGGERE